MEPKQADEEALPLLSGSTYPACRRTYSSLTPTDFQTWMSSIPDDMPVSGLTISGTHDSAARGSLWPFVTTQTLTITEQLDCGIRYLDLRLGLRNDELQMVHGRSLLGLTFSSVLEAIYDFLDRNPSEGIIAQIKRDRPEEKSEMCFSDAIRECVRAAPRRWRTLASTPTMGELRGRIQLFRRYEVDCTNDDASGGRYHYMDDENDTKTQGIDVSAWQNNPPDPFTLLTPGGVSLVIQDHYTTSLPTPFPSLIDVKGGNVSGMLNAAARDPDLNTWYLNFTSAFEINLLYQYTPVQIAKGTRWGLSRKWYVGINPRLLTWLESRYETRDAKRDLSISRQRYGGYSNMGEKTQKGATMSRGQGARYGVVVMDFPDSEPDLALVRAVVRANFDEIVDPSRTLSNFKHYTRIVRRRKRIATVLLLACLFLIWLFGIGFELLHGPARRRQWCLAFCTA